MSQGASINVKASNNEGEIRRFASEPSFAALQASLASRFYEGESLKVTYKDDSDDDVCLSNDEDLQTALQITGSRPLRLKVAPKKDKELLETQAMENLRLNEHQRHPTASDVYVAQPVWQGGGSPPLKKQFKMALVSDPSLLARMQDASLSTHEKASALPSPELQRWYLENQHVASEKLAKLQSKMDCGRLGGRSGACGGGFGKGGKGKGGCGKGKGKGGFDQPHAVHRLQHVLSKHPEIAHQLLSAPHDLRPLEPFHKLHHFCVNHPEQLREQLDVFRAAQASMEDGQPQWVPMRHRIVRYLSNHPEQLRSLRADGSEAAIGRVMADKPGMLRFLKSCPSELPALIDEADAIVAARGSGGGTAGVKRPSGGGDGDGSEKKAKKLERKRLKARVKVVKYLTKHPKELARLRTDPSAAAAAAVFASKPKLNRYLAENADKIAQFVEEAVVLSAERDTSSSSSSGEDAMDEGAVVITPDMMA